MKRALALLLLACAGAPSPAAQDAGRRSTVGFAARISELVIPGPQLEVAPPEPNPPVALRILAVRPHGGAFRYDLEYQAFEPGTHDLARYLARVPGSSGAPPVPPIVVEVESLLPPGQVLPHAPGAGAIPSTGGYRLLLGAAGGLWIAVLLWLLAGGRRRRQERGAAQRPRTLAERLEPLVRRAIRGELSRGERAALELSLVALWQRRLGLAEAEPAAALSTLREHAQAGPLLRGLEEWLHRPERAEVDVGALLAPYRELAAEELVLPEQAERAARGRS